MTGIYFVMVLAFGVCLSAVVLLSCKHGSKSAQLEALKAELRKQAREQERAREIANRVRIMDEHSVRQRLHEIANKQH